MDPLTGRRLLLTLCAVGGALFLAPIAIAALGTAIIFAYAVAYALGMAGVSDQRVLVVVVLILAVAVVAPVALLWWAMRLVTRRTSTPHESGGTISPLLVTLAAIPGVYVAFWLKGALPERHTGAIMILGPLAIGLPVFLATLVRKRRASSFEESKSD